MKIKGVEHIGIAVENLDECMKMLERLFGLKCTGKERIEATKVEIAFFPCGGTKIELVTPISETSPITKFLKHRGNGIHHLCLDVEGIEEWLGFLKSKGVILIDEEPRQGAHCRKVAFIDPRSTGGFLIELSEEV